MKDDKICARGERHGIIGILQVPSVQCSDDFWFEHDSLAIADCSYTRGWWNRWQARSRFVCVFIHGALEAMEVQRALLLDVSPQTKKVMSIDLSHPYSLSLSLSTNPLSSEGTNFIFRPRKEKGSDNSD